MFNDTYKEAFVICRLISVDEHDDGNDRLVLDMPATIQNLTVVSQGKIYTGDLPLSLDGAECIAHVVYSADQDEAVTPYKISGDVKRHPAYATHYPHTVGDVKTAELRSQLPEGYAGELPVYDGADAGDPAPFCVFAEDGYVDR